MQRHRLLLFAVVLWAVVACADDVRRPALHRLAVSDAPMLDAEGSHLTRQWAVRFRRGADVSEDEVTLVADRHGHVVSGRVHGHLGDELGWYVFEEREDSRRRGLALISEASEVAEAVQQVAVQRQRRAIFSDPLYQDQWHLHPMSWSNVHINAEAAWTEFNVTGRGVVIGVVDDGLQYTHPDLAPGYRADLSWDFNYNDNDPIPTMTIDNHGTAAGGAAAAASNSACGVGSAPGSSTCGLRIISAPTTDVEEAGAVGYKPQQISIYTNSWGPPDDGRRKEGPGPLATAALRYTSLNGRGGRGGVYVWAAGNGRSGGDNCNYDGWANRRDTLTVGAVDYAGVQAWYSEDCAAMNVVAPSSGSDSSKYITTTDLLGSIGLSTTDCTSRFSGTSAAAPIIAGVVAMLLEANPYLGWRDVQGVLMTTATRVSANDASWAKNGGGYWASHKFGFGLVDARAAIAAAKSWANFPEPVFRRSFSYEGAAQAIPNSAQGAALFAINVTAKMVIEHVELYFSASIARRGQLGIQLTAPSGMVSVLAASHSDNGSNYDRWRFGSVMHWGEQSSGTWTLSVTDLVQDSVDGTATAVELVLYGH